MLSIKMKNLLIKWYEVKFTVNGEEFIEDFSCLGEDLREVEAEINSELNDRFWGEDWQIIYARRIKTPDNMKIEGLEFYYNWEEENIL